MADDVQIGVLAMQGAFAEHVRALNAVPFVHAYEVRTVARLDVCDGIVLPGGESTAIRKALDRAGLLDELRRRIASGLAAFGTCAGLIVLAHAAPDGAPDCFGVLDIDVERNGFGRQVHSRERLVDLGQDEPPLQGVFIRAPRITRIGPHVNVVGTLRDDRSEIVAVQQEHLLGVTFHPELTADARMHERFVDIVRSGR